MISVIQKLLKEHPAWLRLPGKELSFLKTSTPASGSKAHRGKVILFVFEAGEKNPTLCIKTTRTYVAGEIIRRHHENLKQIVAQVDGSKWTSIFAKPLYLFDDGATVFCVETVCPGVRLGLSPKNIQYAIEQYIGWQTYLAQNLGTSLREIPQHGDMTPDNVLISGKDVYLIDYDYAGRCVVPGFDLFNFISKMKVISEVKTLCYEKYFPRYFKSVGVNAKYEELLPLYHNEEVKRKLELC